MFGDGSVELTVFAVGDLTNPSPLRRSISLNEIPPERSPPIDFRNLLKSPGQTFSAREPFFVRIRPSAPQTTIAKFTITIVKHIGDSIGTAIELEPHVTIDPELTVNQKLGDADSCFFRLSAPARFSRQAYSEIVRVTNSSADQFALQEIDPTTLVKAPTRCRYQVTHRLM